MTPYELRTELKTAEEVRAIVYDTYEYLTEVKRRLRLLNPKIIDLDATKDMVEEALDCLADTSKSLDDADTAAHIQITLALKAGAKD